VALTGREKAALLLTNLDKATASELLKGLAPDDMEQIGIELARLHTTGRGRTDEALSVVQEFVEILKDNRAQSINLKNFLNDVLLSSVEKEKAEQIKNRIKKATEKRDPFAEIRLAETNQLVLALEDEHPQAIAVILSELPWKKSQEVLSFLNEDVRKKTICKMTSQGGLGAIVAERIASTISAKLRAFEGETLIQKPVNKQESLRKVAIMLNGMEKELREQLIEEIKRQDEETASIVRKLMVTWEDIPSIADRSLQEALRNVDAKTLALALFGEGEQITQKIRSNISERLGASLDEEASLMQEPLPKEVLVAREQIVKPLREANEEDKLRFVQR